MKYLFKILIIFTWTLGGVAGCANQNENNAASTITRNFNPDWAQHKLWDDGLAEVATYAAERVVYNKSRTFDYTLITVKEDFNREYNVKTDDYSRKDLFPVMKVNQFCRIPTDNYPYHFLTSLFFKRGNPVQLHKLTSSAQEWCGNTFKSITTTGNDYNYAFNSYWDGQGDGNMTLEKDILFEDQLPYTLRSLKFKNGLVFKAKVAELMQTNKATKPNIYQASFVVAEENETGSKPAWKVVVNLTPEKQNIYLFSREYPNIMLQQYTWDNRNLQLKEVKRYAYWQH